MTEQEVFCRLAPLIGEVTGAPVEEIRMDSVLMQDLGAESLDLLDLSFLIEEQFGVCIDPDEFEKQVSGQIPGGVYEKDGYLTLEALAALVRAIPELDKSGLKPPLRKMELPALLTVAVFVNLIRQKIGKAVGANAQG